MSIHIRSVYLGRYVGRYAPARAVWGVWMVFTLDLGLDV